MGDVGAECTSLSPAFGNGEKNDDGRDLPLVKRHVRSLDSISNRSLFVHRSIRNWGDREDEEVSRLEDSELETSFPTELFVSRSVSYTLFVSMVEIDKRGVIASTGGIGSNVVASSNSVLLMSFSILSNMAFMPWSASDTCRSRDVVVVSMMDDVGAV